MIDDVTYYVRQIEYTGWPKK